MTDSRLEPKRRRAALKHASEAHRLITGLQHSWRLMGVTRQAARELDPIIAAALKAVTTLTDTAADHCSAAVLLRSVVEALDRIAQPRLESSSREEAQRALARDEAHRAYKVIAAHSSRGTEY